MDGQAALAGDVDGLGMDGAGVAIEGNVGDGEGVKLGCEEFGPVIERGIKRDEAPASAPEYPVTCVEADAVDGRAGVAQAVGQEPEKGAVRPLQHQEVPACAGFCTC